VSTSIDSDSCELIVHRDSVAAGDDADAPHEIKFSAKPGATLADVLATIRAARYLASISGGQATWIVESGPKALAVIAQQWSVPRYLEESSRDIRLIVSRSVPCQLFFKYWCQADPELVYVSLRDGKALPPRY
jgi:hypothetical protein